MKKHFTLFILSFIIGVLLLSCNSTTESKSNKKVLTISNFGVDWSEGVVSQSSTSNIIHNLDGQTIAWCPNGNGGGWGTGVWYRSSSNKIYKWGTGNLDNVNTVDTTKWDADICDSPLKNGDIWISETLDGYVVFKVLDTPADSVALANNPMWEVKVEYKFSTEIDF